MTSAKLSVSFFVFLFSIASFVHADSLSALTSFVKNTKNGRAQFTQTVTQPKSDRVKISRGTFEFLRPNRFKFIYKKPFEQSIISDGQTLWLYDVDLNQITKRSLALAMQGSPAALFASAPDLQSLQSAFKLQDITDKQPVKNDLQWVLATPVSNLKKNAAEASDNLLQSIKLGLKNVDTGVELAVIEMVDSFGQLSVITFENEQINIQLSARDFVFTPPVGVDVLKQ